MGVFFNSSLWSLSGGIMLKLFNGKLYVILTIKQEEKQDILDIIDKHGLDIMYPKVFEENSNLDRFCIDDERFGGHLANFICWYEFSIIKNFNKAIFKNVGELKAYLKKVEQRQEQYFLSETQRDNYYSYIDSLNNKDLVDEYYLVKSVIAFLDAQYLCLKDFISNLSHSIVNELKRTPSKEIVDSYLKRLRKYIDELDDALDIELYLINKDNCAREVDHSITSFDSNVTYANMRTYLKAQFERTHYSNDSSFHKLKAAKNNLKLIFNIFNYKLNAEGKVSLMHDAYKNIRDIGYENGVPDYLVGVKKEKGWDYTSVLKRLLYTLRIFDCYPLLSNRIIQLIYGDANEVELLANKLVELGYEDRQDLCHASEHIPIGMLIFPYEKYFRGSSSITVMACMCSSRKRQPLTPKDVMNHLDKIIINYDFVHWNLLLKENDKKRK